MWKERFGITDADIRDEHVTDVNVVNDAEDANEGQLSLNNSQ